MATINTRKIVLIITWDKDDAANLSYQVDVSGYVDDDSEQGGANLRRDVGDPETMTRVQFRGLTGEQIETQIKNRAVALLQALGSGAGGHTINDDTGD